MKTSAEQRLRNRALRSNMKKAIKALKENSSRDEVDANIGNVLGLIDKAARKNIIHKNKAARDKSRLIAFRNRLS